MTSQISAPPQDVTANSAENLKKGLPPRHLSTKPITARKLPTAIPIPEIDISIKNCKRGSVTLFKDFCKETFRGQLFAAGNGIYSA